MYQKIKQLQQRISAEVENILPYKSRTDDDQKNKQNNNQHETSSVPIAAATIAISTITAHTKHLLVQGLLHCMLIMEK